EMMEWKTTNNGEEPVFLIKVVNAFKEGIQMFFDMLLWLIGIWPIVVAMALLIIFRKAILVRIRFKSRTKA
nr:hypothetical protein [Saprospiraceae bacterium]